MAEVVGIVTSGVTLAGPFASCVEIFSLIDLHNNANDRHVSLSTQLKIQQCRLYMWGQNMGLTKPPRRHLGLHDPSAHLSGTPFANVFHDILNLIFMLFEDPRSLRLREG
jgi:hypothetical protein